MDGRKDGWIDGWRMKNRKRDQDVKSWKEREMDRDSTDEGKCFQRRMDREMN